MVLGDGIPQGAAPGQPLQHPAPHAPAPVAGEAPAAPHNRPRPSPAAAPRSGARCSPRCMMPPTWRYSRTPLGRKRRQMALRWGACQVAGARPQDLSTGSVAQAPHLPPQAHYPQAPTHYPQPAQAPEPPHGPRHHRNSGSRPWPKHPTPHSLPPDPRALPATGTPPAAGALPLASVPIPQPQPQYTPHPRPTRARRPLALRGACGGPPEHPTRSRGGVPGARG